MTKEIPAYTVKRWLENLEKIHAALVIAEAIPGIPVPSVWKPIWEAKCTARALRAELIDRAVGSVAVEAIPAAPAAEPVVA